LTVGKSGAAGGTYTENRSDARYQNDPAKWFDSTNTLLDLSNPTNAESGATTGNAPGLAITAGAKATSGYGMVGENAGSNGYVLIDTKDKAGTPTSAVRSEWHVENDLSIAKDGNAFVRVLNGSLLQVAQDTKLNSTGGTTAASHGTLHVIGNGAATAADGKPVYKEGNNFPTDKFIDGNYARYTALTPYGNRTEWISGGATVLGDVAAGQTGAGRGTIRINDGGYGETKGLYVGLKSGSFGEVSVQGAASELHILKDTNSAFQGSTPAGSSLLSVSDKAFLQLHTDAVLKINGNGMFSNDSILHLDPNSQLDAMTDRVSFVGARIEGIGTVAGDKGIVIMQDGTYSKGTAIIDPGLAYGWDTRDEDPRYYGTLTFGDQLLMSGDVITNFDINSGYFEPPAMAASKKQDLIVVERRSDSQSSADIYAELSGTLNVHARLTDFYDKDTSFIVVDTEGDDKSGEFVPGKIIGLYDTLKVMPSRFFEEVDQEIRKDARTNEDLWITMKRKEDPFEEAGKTYNEKQTGKGLDNAYKVARDNKEYGGRDWLPLLRYFWYLEDPEFLRAYRLFSGEIRAHSMLLPMQDLWRYANNQMEFRPCDCPDEVAACAMLEESRNIDNLSCASWEKRMKRFVKDGRLWGSVIYQDNHTRSDGNAGAYDITRTGGVVGFDKPVFGPNTYLGIQLAFADSKLRAYRSQAEADDFSFGIYHGTKIQDIWEWKNYIGMGIQDYTMSRSLDLKLTDLVWNPATGIYDNVERDLGGHTLDSDFTGYTFSASTEFARPFYFGKCKQLLVRPYIGLDLSTVWQNSASETPGAAGTELVTLDYHSTSNVRIYGRPGITVERNGHRSSIRAGLAYSFLMGGRRYTNVNNKFQFGNQFNPGTEEFNIRGVDDGSGFLTLNFGSGLFLGKRKLTSVMFDYSAYLGSNSTTQAMQLGLQKRF
jgi:outer membrane autotransporter protein